MTAPNFVTASCASATATACSHQKPGGLHYHRLVFPVSEISWNLCGGLSTRLPTSLLKPPRRVDNPPQVDNLPHIRHLAGLNECRGSSVGKAVGIGLWRACPFFQTMMKFEATPRNGSFCYSSL